MNTLAIVLIAAVCLAAAYLLYGRWLANKWGIDIYCNYCQGKTLTNKGMPEDKNGRLVQGPVFSAPGF